MFEIVDSAPQSAVIKVIGVGGGGGNAVQHMVTNNVEGVDFIAANTDAQALKAIGAKTLLQLGSTITRGTSTCGGCSSANITARATSSGSSGSGMFCTTSIFFVPITETVLLVSAVKLGPVPKSVGAQLQPQSSGREDRGEPTRRAEREHRPHVVESAGLGDHAALRVDDDHARRDQPAE